MNESRIATISDPRLFMEMLQTAMEGLYAIFELSREHDLPPIIDGDTVYTREKLCFQVSRQYDRPSEFLQTVLDIVRVNYEPHVFGTLLLNANMGFLYDGIPESPFRLAYASMTSARDKEFGLFWSEDVLPHLDAWGYNLDSAAAIYAVVSTGEERYTQHLVGEVENVLDVGFSLEDAEALLLAAIRQDGNWTRQQTYTGFCLDTGLESKIRLSLWMFVPCQE